MQNSFSVPIGSLNQSNSLENKICVTGWKTSSCPQLHTTTTRVMCIHMYFQGQRTLRCKPSMCEFGVKASPLGSHHVLLALKLRLQSLQLLRREDGAHALWLALLPRRGREGATGVRTLLLRDTCVKNLIRTWFIMNTEHRFWCTCCFLVTLPD